MKSEKTLATHPTVRDAIYRRQILDMMVSQSPGPMRLFFTFKAERPPDRHSQSLDQHRHLAHSTDIRGSSEEIGSPVFGRFIQLEQDRWQ